MTRLAILASHPVQYYAPLFREVAKRLDLTVYYAHAATAQDQARSGFGVGFTWDVDLLSGYRYVFLKNVARDPELGRFAGVDTPEIGPRLRDGHFDGLLLMGWYLKCFLQGLIAAKRLGLPVMVRGDSHLDTPRSTLKIAAKRLFYPYFLKRFDVALVVGKRNRSYWKYYGYPETRMVDAPHCVDNSFFAKRATPSARSALRQRLGIPPEARIALFAGKLLPFKRPLEVIEGAALVRKTGLDVHVLVAGSGPLEVAMRDSAEALGVPLHLLGFCNQTEMPSVYAAADMLVLPSDGRETWGLVINESLASGTPALISDTVGCAPDIASLLGQEAIFKLGAVPELAEKMRKMIISPPPAEAIADAVARFDLAVVADCIGEVTASLNKRRNQAD